MTRTWPLRGGECVWQAPPRTPTGLFVVSPRSSTWSVQAIHTPFESAHVFPFWRTDATHTTLAGHERMNTHSLA
jgi:hypothetical protein